MPEEHSTKVELATSPFFVRVVSSSHRLRSLANAISVRLSQYVTETGKTFSPYAMAAKTVFAFVLTLVLLTVFVIPLAVLVHPMLLALLVLPIFILISPWLIVRMWIGDRRRAVEEELPFFSIHAAILQAAGRDIYSALCSLIGRNVFPQIERDAAIMQRNTTYFRMGPIEGIEELGRTTPNPKMSSLLLGYTSEWRAGGDAKRYLEQKTNELLKEAEDRWEKYTGSVTYVGEMIISVMFLVPLLLLTSVFLSPDAGSSIAYAFLIIVFPIFCTVSIALIRSIQPKSYDVIDGSAVLGIVFAAICGAAAIYMNLPVWAMVVSTLFGLFLGYGLPVLFQLREISAHERAITAFLRDVTEYQKMGYDIVRATIKISSENRYNFYFDRLLSRIAWQLSLGHRFSEVKFSTRSWLTRAAFFHLSEIAESGAYETISLELLTDFIGNVSRMKRKAKSSLTIHRVLAMVTPLFLAVVVGVLTGLMQQFFISPSITGLVVPSIMPQVSPYLVSLCHAVIIVSAIGVSLMSTYAHSFTMKNTAWVAINAALAGVGILISQPIASLIPAIAV